MPSLPSFLADMPQQPMLIGGSWLAASDGATIESCNPATGKLLATIPAATALDVDKAVVAARTAFGEWARTLPVERQAILLRLADLLEDHAEEISLLDTLDMGAPLWRTRGSIALMAGILRYNAGLALSIEGRTIQPSASRRFAAVVKAPVGVCAAIIPWNSPGWSAVLNVAPALAAGCTMVLKPAEDGSLAPLFFGRLCMEAGVPAGVVNVVTGHGTVAGAALAKHPDVDKIAFTGSTATGQGIVRASAGNLKKTALELGGKSPNIVFADADLEAAADAAISGAFGNSGQVCSAGSRLFVERGIEAAFSEALAERIARLVVGNGLSDGVDLGPLVSARQRDRVLGYVEGARAEGAVIAVGGSALSGPGWDEGFFMSPTIVRGARDDMAVVREEIFGPVVCLLPFDDLDEVIARANATAYGLGAAVWTRDIGKAHRAAMAIQAGSVWINCYNALDPVVPAGGWKQSGTGREYGEDHLDAFLQTKTIWLAPSFA